ncbi:tyrosine-type recombinase/integrase [Paenibacillus sp. LHD-117]|uniref:tyrosine-type recombinase/integrase n=1 Tax=Paenibacillus sp. LHD-117 TaxID=3071412 RepID=UPI0027E1EE89|nr:tyrosine-type recombinase/integrase [Paenibacillus sp. LHD-117]MDQ6418686.1 tyrosine-type recombinase/integrase [Paenibacillus sp. LHD-117]
MKTVQPIRDDRVVEGMKQYFRVRSMRNYLFFCIGIYSGLRVSDLITIQAGEVRSSHVFKMERKNKHNKRFIIHPSYRFELELYIADMQDHEYLFASRQRKTISKLKKEPIDRSTAYRFLTEAARLFGLSEIGNHTLRKTWGYRLYTQDEANLALLMEAFGHRDFRDTLRYIGITQDMLDRATLRMR